MAARTRNPFGEAPLRGSGNGIERGAVLSVSPSTQETRLATPPRKIERWKGDAIVARVQSVHSFLFLFFHPPTFPPLSECESGSNVDPRDASSPSPPSFKCAFFLFFFFLLRRQSRKRKPRSPLSHHSR